MAALAKAPIHQKQGHVNARPATPGEEITTTLENGAQETINTAKEGDGVVTKPSGEQYILGGGEIPRSLRGDGRPRRVRGQGVLPSDPQSLRKADRDHGLLG